MNPTTHHHPDPDGDPHGVGPLEPLLSAPDILEIMINGPHEVFVERGGSLQPAGVAFEDEAHLNQVVERIIARYGLKLDPANPILDLRLPDNSRMLVVSPPIAVKGVKVVIRRLPPQRWKMPDLVGFGSLTQTMADFLMSCVRHRLNIAVVGSVGAGKTTVLSTLVDAIPAEERVITVEDALFLVIDNPHLVRLESRPADTLGRGEVTLRQLVEIAAKMRPDRIVVGEVTGPEVYALVQAMNLGIDGSMFSLHAANVADALTRLEMMMAQANPALPILALRDQLASALDIITFQMRLDNGRRVLTRVCAVTGVEGSVVNTQDLFTYMHPTDHHPNGLHIPTGTIPDFVRTKLKGDLPTAMLGKS
jgi:pilus assembly protein CpaF